MFWLWSPIEGGGFRGEIIISWKEFDPLSKDAVTSGFSSVELGRVTAGYSVSRNWVISESFGRAFVDGPVDLLVKVVDVIAVFQCNGRDHWFREMSY